jgi:hypothetical protein
VWRQRPGKVVLVVPAVEVVAKLEIALLPQALCHQQIVRLISRRSQAVDVVDAHGPVHESAARDQGRRSRHRKAQTGQVEEPGGGGAQRHDQDDDGRRPQQRLQRGKLGDDRRRARCTEGAARPKPGRDRGDETAAFHQGASYPDS